MVQKALNGAPLIRLLNHQWECWSTALASKMTNNKTYVGRAYIIANLSASSKPAAKQTPEPIFNWKLARPMTNSIKGSKLKPAGVITFMTW